MTILKGLLVDLVPVNGAFEDKMWEFWNDDSRQWAFMGDYGPISRASIKRIAEHRREGAARGYTGVHFMLRARDGQIIGTIGLNWVNQWSRTASTGAWIGDKDYWSGGHGTDALLLLMDYAFGWLDLRRMDLGTMAPNLRAQQNVERCGFRLEARRRGATFVNGEPIDVLEYGILRDEWPGRAALVERLNLRQRAEQRYGKVE